MTIAKCSAPALLAGALLLAGCGANAVTPLEPATTTVPAPSTTPAASSTAQATVQPSALLGRWEPISKALRGAGPLTLTARSLTWAPCGSVPRATDAQSSGTSVLLTLPGQLACKLGDQAVTHLRMAPRAGNGCEMELSVYEGAVHGAHSERLAWGVYERQGCAGKAPATPETQEPPTR